MTKLFAGIRLDQKRYDECMAELRRVGVSFDPAGIKRAKARISSVYPDLEGYLFMVALRLALLEWRTPAEQQKQYRHEVQLAAHKREKAAEQRSARAELKQINLKYAAQQGLEPERVAAHRLESVLREIVAAAEKAQQYDRIADLLDAWTVGGRALGDCTQQQLFDAGDEWTAAGEAAINRGDLYRQLAEKMRPDETVRTSSKLSELLVILGAAVSAFSSERAPAVRAVSGEPHP
jgi:hypothetical protein